MWVCIRPGVVKSANEERVIPRCIPVQFIVSMEAISFRILVGSKLKDASRLAPYGWACPLE
jgi:hypothetical protein